MIAFPFYTSLAERDYERTNSPIARTVPRHKLPPFQIQRSLSITFGLSAYLVDCHGNETDITSYFENADAQITGWTNVSFDTFSATGSTINSVTCSGSAHQYAYSNEFTCSENDVVIVTISFPGSTSFNISAYLGTAGRSEQSNVETFNDSASTTTIILRCSADTGGKVRLILDGYGETGSATNFTPDITVYRIEYSKFTTYDFISYHGLELNTELPYGVYYLRINDGVANYYSEWFSVKNIQSQLVTGWTNSTYETFTSSANNITSAIETGSSGFALSNDIVLRKGQKVLFNAYLLLNSGQAPFVSLYTAIGASTNIQLSAGMNEIELTPTKSDTFKIRISNSAASNFSLSSVKTVYKAGNFIHINFSNTNDLSLRRSQNASSLKMGDILYQTGWHQEVWIETYLNNPNVENVEIGEEYDGVFIPESVSATYLYSIITQQNRSMFLALAYLRLHDDITITDEIGNEYTPDPGNIDVTMDWTTYDTGTLKIEFNDGSMTWNNGLPAIT